MPSSKKCFQERVSVRFPADCRKVAPLNIGKIKWGTHFQFCLVVVGDVLFEICSMHVPIVKTPFYVAFLG